MSQRAGAPLVHLAILAAVLLMLIVGGSVTFGAWGSMPVRIVGIYVLAATLLHGVSGYVSGGLYVRAASWLVLLAMPLHVQGLLRPEVLVPIAAVGLVDLVVHRTQLSADVPVPAGTGAKVLAGVTSVVALGALTALVLVAENALVLGRLGAVVVIAWGLVTVLALRPETRSPWTLLGAGAAFSVSFSLLAAPLLPFGPLIGYWVTVVAIALAVLASTFTESADPLDEGTTRHRQEVRPLPDPVLAPLADQVRRFLNSGHGARSLSTRLENALGRDEGGRLLSAMCEAQSRGTKPSRADRRRALAELLQTEIDDPREENA